MLSTDRDKDRDKDRDGWARSTIYHDKTWREDGRPDGASQNGMMVMVMVMVMVMMIGGMGEWLCMMWSIPTRAMHCFIVVSG